VVDGVAGGSEVVRGGAGRGAGMAMRTEEQSSP
jgi:hypothetical protein